MKALLVLSVALALSLGGTTSASARTMTTHQAKVKYAKADGVVKWIGSHARFTQYSPNVKKKRHWQAAVHFWVEVRKSAWLVLHPQPVVDISAWQQTVNCENSGNWADSPGFFYLGLQFDPTTWRTAASHTGHWGTSPVDQVINAIWTAQNAKVDPWPNCPDPYFG